MRYRSAWACRSAVYVRWAQKKGALVARPSGGAEVVPASGALFRPESAGREGQRRLLLIIPALAVSRLGRNEQLKALSPSNTSSFPRRVFCARVLKLWLRDPDRRVAERRESSGACEAPVGPARNAAGQAPSEAPCVP